MSRAKKLRFSYTWRNFTRFHALFIVCASCNNRLASRACAASASIPVRDDDIGGCIKSEAEARGLKLNENISEVLG